MVLLSIEIWTIWKKKKMSAECINSMNSPEKLITFYEKGNIDENCWTRRYWRSRIGGITVQASDALNATVPDVRIGDLRQVIDC